MHVIVTHDDERKTVDMTGVTTVTEANARLQAAGVGDFVRVLSSEEVAQQRAEFKHHSGRADRERLVKEELPVARSLKKCLLEMCVHRLLSAGEYTRALKRWEKRFQLSFNATNVDEETPL